MNSLLTNPSVEAFCTKAIVVLVDSAAKGVILLCLAWSIALGMKRASAAARHLVWTLALGGLLMLPALSLALPKWQLPILPRPVAIAPKIIPAPLTAPPSVPAESIKPAPMVAQDQIVTKPAVPASVRPAAPFVARPVISKPIPASVIVFAVWLAVAAIALIPLGAGILLVRRIIKNSSRLDRGAWTELLGSLSELIGLRRNVRLYRSNGPTMPIAIGIFRPAIVLPAEADNWPDEKRRAVLLHELAHVRRWDCFTHILTRLACVMHWFNPLAWIALGKLQNERERACDDLALTAGTRPTVYANELLSIARAMHSGPATSAAAIPMARKSQLEGRLLSILDDSSNRREVTKKILSIAALLCVMIVGTLAVVKLTSPNGTPDGLEPKPVLSNKGPNTIRLIKQEKSENERTWVWRVDSALFMINLYSDVQGKDSGFGSTGHTKYVRLRVWLKNGTRTVEIILSNDEQLNGSTGISTQATEITNIDDLVPYVLTDKTRFGDEKLPIFKLRPAMNNRVANQPATDADIETFSVSMTKDSPPDSKPNPTPTESGGASEPKLRYLSLQTHEDQVWNEDHRENPRFQALWEPDGTRVSYQDLNEKPHQFFPSAHTSSLKDNRLLVVTFDAPGDQFQRGELTIEGGSEILKARDRLRAKDPLRKGTFWYSYLIAVPPKVTLPDEGTFTLEHPGGEWTEIISLPINASDFTEVTSNLKGFTVLGNEIIANVSRTTRSMDNRNQVGGTKIEIQDRTGDGWRICSMEAVPNEAGRQKIAQRPLDTMSSSRLLRNGVREYTFSITLPPEMISNIRILTKPIVKTQYRAKLLNFEGAAGSKGQQDRAVEAPPALRYLSWQTLEDLTWNKDNYKNPKTRALWAPDGKELRYSDLGYKSNDIHPLFRFFPDAVDKDKRVLIVAFESKGTQAETGQLTLEGIPEAAQKESSRTGDPSKNIPYWDAYKIVVPPTVTLPADVVLTLTYPSGEWTEIGTVPPKTENINVGAIDGDLATWSVFDDGISVRVSQETAGPMRNTWPTRIEIQDAKGNGRRMCSAEAVPNEAGLKFLAGQPQDRSSSRSEMGNGVVQYSFSTKLTTEMISHVRILTKPIIKTYYNGVKLLPFGNAEPKPVNLSSTADGLVIDMTQLHSSNADNMSALGSFPIDYKGHARFIGDAGIFQLHILADAAKVFLPNNGTTKLELHESPQSPIQIGVEMKGGGLNAQRMDLLKKIAEEHPAAQTFIVLKQGWDGQPVNVPAPAFMPKAIRDSKEWIDWIAQKSTTSHDFTHTDTLGGRTVVHFAGCVNIAGKLYPNYQIEKFRADGTLAEYTSYSPGGPDNNVIESPENIRVYEPDGKTLSWEIHIYDDMGNPGRPFVEGFAKRMEDGTYHDFDSIENGIIYHAYKDWKKNEKDGTATRGDIIHHARIPDSERKNSALYDDIKFGSEALKKAQGVNENGQLTAIGRVADMQSNPVRDFLVSCGIEQDGQMYGDTAKEFHDYQGTFELPVNYTDRFLYRIVVSADGYLPYRSGLLTPDQVANIENFVKLNRTDGKTSSTAPAAPEPKSPLTFQYLGEKSKPNTMEMDGEYQWLIDTKLPIRVGHGYMNEQNNIVVENVGGGEDASLENGPVEFTLKVGRRPQGLALWMSKSRGGKKSTVQSTTDIPVGTSFESEWRQQPVDARGGDILIVLWEGRFVHNGKVVKKVTYAAKASDSETSDMSFMPASGTAIMPLHLSTAPSTAPAPEPTPIQQFDLAVVQMMQSNPEVIKITDQIFEVRPIRSAMATGRSRLFGIGSSKSVTVFLVNGRKGAAEVTVDDKKTITKIIPVISPIQATLPNGAIVELIGVGPHPGKDQSWWKPDGTPLEYTPSWADGEFEEMKEAGMKPYELAVRYRWDDVHPDEADGDQLPFNAEPVLPDKIHSSGSYTRKLKEPVLPGIIHFSTPEAMDQFDLKLVCMGGKPAFTSEVKFAEKTETMATPLGTATVSAPVKSDQNHFIVQVASNFSEADDWYFVWEMIDTNGQKYTPDWRRGSTIQFTDPGPPMTRPATLRLKAYAKESVTFKNISLKPGTITRVESEVGQSPAAKLKLVTNPAATSASIDTVITSNTAGVRDPNLLSPSRIREGQSLIMRNPFNQQIWAITGGTREVKFVSEGETGTTAIYRVSDMGAARVTVDLQNMKIVGIKDDSRVEVDIPIRQIHQEYSYWKHPALILKIRAKNAGDLPLHLNPGALLEVDGQWYEYVHPRMLDEKTTGPVMGFTTGAPASTLEFGPGAEYSGLDLLVGDNWRRLVRNDIMPIVQRRFGQKVYFKEELRKDYGERLVLTPGIHSIRIAVVTSNVWFPICAYSEPITIQVTGKTTELIFQARKSIEARTKAIRAKKLKIEYTRTITFADRPPFVEQCTLLAFGGNYREEARQPDGKTELRYYVGMPQPDDANAIRATVESSPAQITYNPVSFVHHVDSTLAHLWSERPGFWREMLEAGRIRNDVEIDGKKYVELLTARNEACYFAPELGWAIAGVRDWRFEDLTQIDGIYWPRKITLDMSQQQHAAFTGESILISKIETQAKFDAALLELPRPKPGMIVNVMAPLWDGMPDQIALEKNPNASAPRKITWKSPLSPEDQRYFMCAMTRWRVSDFSTAFNKSYPMPYLDSQRNVIVWVKYDHDTKMLRKVHEGDTLPDSYGPPPYQDLNEMVQGWQK